MTECLFCNLRTLKEGLIYGDDMCYILPDKYPISKGHILVIAAAHYPDMLSTPDDIIGHMFAVAKRYAKISVGVTGATGVNIGTNVGASAGQAIMHFHIHVVPRYDGQEHIFDYGKNKELLPADREQMVRAIREAAAERSDRGQ